MAANVRTEEFSSQALAAIDRAYTEACDALRLKAPATYHLQLALAKRNVALARTGETDVHRLCRSSILDGIDRTQDGSDTQVRRTRGTPLKDKGQRLPAIDLQVSCGLTLVQRITFDLRSA